MKNRILTYVLFGLLALTGIVLYFVNPNVVAFQVTMSFGASLIGAVFVAISLEAINSSKRKRSTQTIQKYLLSSLKISLEQFYSWYIAYLARRYKVEQLEFNGELGELLQTLFAATRKQINDGKVDIDENYTMDRVEAKLDVVIDAVEKLNRTLKNEIPTLITNEIIEQQDMEFFEKLLVKLNDVLLLDRLGEKNVLLVEILNDLSASKIVVLEQHKILTERIRQKLLKQAEF